MMNPEIDHSQMLLISHELCSPAGIYTQIVPDQQGKESMKPRRRRKKSKNDEEGDGGMVLRKRKLNEKQANLLEQSFRSEHKLESERKDKLAAELGLDPRQVAVWFQNRRTRWKSKNMEEEYSKLKSQHDTDVVEKCRLETELLRVKEQLHQAKKEILRLSDGFSSNSPSSSFSMEPPFLGEFGMEGLEGVFCDPDNNYVNGFEWDNLYYV